jgi:hypothetical protein
MGEKDKQIEILKKMASNEEKLSELYKIFYRKFEDHGKFWKDISGEELRHAAWIRRIAGEMLNGKVYFTKSKKIINSVDYFSDQIEENIKKADKKDFGILDAISIARILESFFLENKCFEIVSTDIRYLKDLLDKLRADTDRHLKVVEKEWVKIIKDL